ncbi:MFS transporter [Adhaeretor mobilis]|nr:MFS transporter [Adhaeretor mobilis]
MSNFPAANQTAIKQTINKQELPTLYADRSFWGMTVTQFLGAFNDNLFKQLVLLLSIVTLADGSTVDRQGMATAIFSASFLVVTGFAGYLSDRLSKRGIIIACKVAEIVVMGLGAMAFYAYMQSESLVPLLLVLFLMGAQSGFFGPAKYGILPEMLAEEDLPRANGFFLMTTFIAIILGIAAAGALLDIFPEKKWIGSIISIAIATVGTISSLFVRKTPVANPGLELKVSSFLVPPDMIRLLRLDKPLLAALVVSSIFWMMANMVLLGLNSLGKVQFMASETQTSMLSAVVSLGIATGCVLGGLISKGRIDFRLMHLGAIGLVVCLAIMAVPSAGDITQLVGPDGKLMRLPGFGESAQWLGYFGSIGVLGAAGIFTGLFAVPLQVFMQTRPPDDKKGRMIAVMNQANWIGIAISGLLYKGAIVTIKSTQQPRSLIFLYIGLLMLPIVLFYRPKNEPHPDSPKVSA